MCFKDILLNKNQVYAMRISLLGRILLEIAAMIMGNKVMG
jgi:hypothetical protein